MSESLNKALVVFNCRGNVATRLYEPYKVGDWKEDCPSHYNETSGLCGML